MDLPSKHVHSVLVDAGVTDIYHANSVTTACHFLKLKSLLSRGSTERRGLRQTGQSSDEIDKRHGLWVDVFADSVDIHERASKRNRYGPVVLRFDVGIIEKTYTGRIWVAKLNPTKWSGTKRDERWFQTKADLDSNFTLGTFDHMLVFRHCGGELPFAGFLQEVIIDDPKMKTADGADLFSIAYGAVRLALSETRLNVPISKRECASRCKCKSEYKAAEEATHEMFVPDV